MVLKRSSRNDARSRADSLLVTTVNEWLRRYEAEGEAGQLPKPTTALKRDRWRVAGRPELHVAVPRGGAHRPVRPFAPAAVAVRS